MHEEKQLKSMKGRITDFLYYLYRIVIIIFAISLFIPSFNPARICGMVNGNMSLFTSGVSYSALTQSITRAVNRGWVQESTFVLLFISSLLSCLGIFSAVAAGCMSLGSFKLRRLGHYIVLIGTFVGYLGLGGALIAYNQVSKTSNTDWVQPMFPNGVYIIGAMFTIVLVLTIVLLYLIPKPNKNEVYSLEAKYKLFLILMPFIALTFVFSYLPLWGWRYAFFDYKAGGTLSWENFVGFKWFTILFQNKATRNDVVKVMQNTLAMSALGLSTSWCAMAFAIFLCEIKNMRIRRFIQTCTTIPNFISWVLVYSFACTIFATDGLISNLIVRNGGTAVNFLMNGDHIWLKMLAWGMWKGIGWSAIVYIAGISGIDQQLYEAATVDGAGRFQKMWHVTVPGLLPTFFVLFLMGVAGILSNGLDQYLVFENPNNTQDIKVLDLYVYKLGIDQGNIPISTVIGMVKSLVSVTLLFIANKLSKIIRGNTII